MEIVTRPDLSGGGDGDLLSVLSGIGLLEIATRLDLSGGGEGDLLSVLSGVGLLWR